MTTYAENLVKLLDDLDADIKHYQSKSEEHRLLDQPYNQYYCEGKAEGIEKARRAIVKALI
jgi:hypothetical protein